MPCLKTFNKTNNAKLAGALISFGASHFILCLIVAEALYDGYSISRNYISELGVGPAALIFNSSTFILGATVFYSAFLLRKSLKDGVLPHLLMTSGIGCMGAALFPYTLGPVHILFSAMAFTSGILAIFTSCRLLASPIKYIYLWLGATSLTAFILFTTGEVFIRFFNAPINLVIGLGGMERMIVYPVLTWALSFGGFLMGSKMSQPFLSTK